MTSPEEEPVRSPLGPVARLARQIAAWTVVAAGAVGGIAGGPAVGLLSALAALAFVALVAHLLSRG